jgi:putative ABC transport system ATP-binding protein
MNEKRNAIMARGLEKTFGSDDTTITVINNLDLTLSAGRFEAIMGPSGSGKSTLLHLIAGLLAPDSGSVFSW